MDILRGLKQTQPIGTIDGQTTELVSLEGIIYMHLLFVDNISYFMQQLHLIWLIIRLLVMPAHEQTTALVSLKELQSTCTCLFISISCLNTCDVIHLPDFSVMLPSFDVPTDLFWIKAAPSFYLGHLSSSLSCLFRLLGGLDSLFESSESLA